MHELMFLQVPVYGSAAASPIILQICSRRQLSNSRLEATAFFQITAKLSGCR